MRSTAQVERVLEDDVNREPHNEHQERSERMSWPGRLRAPVGAQMVWNLLLRRSQVDEFVVRVRYVTQ
jgi:hypothetical protein